MNTALETAALGLRYGRRWALRDCSLSLPAGHVIGLVGPNGAGKTTLLQLAVGLLRPSAGSLSVLGDGSPRERPSLLARIGFVGQDKPLYPSFRVDEMLRLGAGLNPRFDTALATNRLTALGVPLDQRAGKLSGGQRAQVALVIALAKHPELLVLDEPVANLDPLARREFLQVLMADVAESGMTVLLSSHLVADVERVCDHLVLLTAAQVQLDGATDSIVSRHQLLTGPIDREIPLSSGVVISASHTERQSTLLVRDSPVVLDPTWTVQPL